MHTSMNTIGLIVLHHTKLIRTSTLVQCILTVTAVTACTAVTSSLTAHLVACLFHGAKRAHIQGKVSKLTIRYSFISLRLSTHRSSFTQIMLHICVSINMAATYACACLLDLLLERKLIKGKRIRSTYLVLHQLLNLPSQSCHLLSHVLYFYLYFQNSGLGTAMGNILIHFKMAVPLCNSQRVMFKHWNALLLH
jgi:hypothetical protein